MGALDQGTDPAFTGIHEQEVCRVRLHRHGPKRGLVRFDLCYPAVCTDGSRLQSNPIGPFNDSGRPVDDGHVPSGRPAE